MENFAPVAPRISVFTPEKPALGQLVVLCTWLGAAKKHLTKYISIYRKLAPAARILLIQSDVSILTSSYKKQRKAIQPAVSKVLECLDDVKPGSNGIPGDSSPLACPGRIVLHCFSNGGTNTAGQLLLELRKAAGGPIPLAGLCLDSCPEMGTYWKSYNGMLLSLPQGSFLTWILGSMVCHCILLILYSWIAIGNENPASLQRRTLLSEDISQSAWEADRSNDARGRVTYLFSKADQTCYWQDVEEHAKVARKQGWLVNEVLFEDSKHCAHLNKHEDEYVDAVERLWKGEDDGDSWHKGASKL